MNESKTKPQESTCNLPPKQRAFVEAYLQTWNATRAAETARYAHPHVQGSRLLANVRIQAIIQARLKEMALSADDVLARLREQATASVADFFAYNEDGTVSGVDTTILRKKGHLVKKVKVDPDKIEIELYDGQNALALIGKHHQLFTDKVDVTSGGKAIQLIGIDPDGKQEDGN